MPKIILDQFSNRSDLKGYQKFRLRHPDYRHKHASEMRVWRDKNPERVDAIVLRHKKKVRAQAAIAMRERAKRLSQSKSRLGKFIRKDILNLHRRGKDIGMIAVWTHMPVSVVASVIKDNQLL